MTDRSWWIVAALAALWLLRRPLATVTVDAIAEAIGYVESRGNYAAIGPLTSSGRAYGKYQIMEFNIGPWTLRALGRTLTPSAFLADHAAQDLTARTEIARVLSIYGNPSDVAAVWFSGRPLAQAGNADDVTGTTVPEYVALVLARL